MPSYEHLKRPAVALLEGLHQTLVSQLHIIHPSIHRL